MPTVTPRCQMGRVEPYISAQGYMFPCCWVANQPHISRLKTFLGDELFEQLKISTHTNDTIRESQAMKQLSESWKDGSFSSCVNFCGKPFDENEPIARDNHMLINLHTNDIHEF